MKKELELADDDDATAERVAARVDRNYMRFLDANDNGIDVGVPREYPGVPSAVAMYNAVVGTKGNSGFLAAARMCEMILRGEVRSEYRYICAEAEMLKAAKEGELGELQGLRGRCLHRAAERALENTVASRCKGTAVQQALPCPEGVVRAQRREAAGGLRAQGIHLRARERLHRRSRDTRADARHCGGLGQEVARREGS